MKQSWFYWCYHCKQRLATDLIQYFFECDSFCCGLSARISSIHLEKQTSMEAPLLAPLLAPLTLSSPVALIFPRKMHVYSIRAVYCRKHVSQLEQSCKSTWVTCLTLHIHHIWHRNEMLMFYMLFITFWIVRLNLIKFTFFTWESSLNNFVFQ